jgi:hypothetical protein
MVPDPKKKPQQLSWGILFLIAVKGYKNKDRRFQARKKAPPLQ